jgi:hypothetical protein
MTAELTDTKPTENAPAPRAGYAPPYFMEAWEIEINECIWRQQADGFFDGSASQGNANSEDCE